MTKQSKLSLAAALVLGASGLSFGGLQEVKEVSVYNNSSGAGAAGNVSDARNSADNIQYIGCEVIAYKTYTALYCFARNAANQWASCYSTSSPATMIDNARSIGPRSTISFGGAAGCDYVSVRNVSSNGGMQSNVGVAQ